MKRSLVCVHCGTVLGLETRTDRAGTGLLAHLLGLHRELGATDVLPRWAQLLEHFRVVPRL